MALVLGNCNNYCSSSSTSHHEIFCVMQSSKKTSSSTSSPKKRAKVASSTSGKKTSPKILKDAPFVDPILVETNSVVPLNGFEFNDQEEAVEQAPFVVDSFSPVNLSHKRIRGGLEKSLAEARRCWFDAAEKVNPEQPVKLLYGTHCSAEMMDKISGLDTIRHLKFELETDASLWIVQAADSRHLNTLTEVQRQLGNFVVDHIEDLYIVGGGDLGPAFNSRCPDAHLTPAHRLIGDPALAMYGYAVPTCIIEVENTHRSYTESRNLGYEYFYPLTTRLAPPAPIGFRGVEMYILVKLLAQNKSVVVAMWVRDPVNASIVSLSQLISISNEPALPLTILKHFEKALPQGLPPIDPATNCHHHQIPPPGNPNQLPDPFAHGTVSLRLPSAQLFARLSNEAGVAVPLPVGMPANLDIDVGRFAKYNKRSS